LLTGLYGDGPVWTGVLTPAVNTNISEARRSGGVLPVLYSNFKIVIGGERRFRHLPTLKLRIFDTVNLPGSPDILNDY